MCVMATNYRPRGVKPYPTEYPRWSARSGRSCSDTIRQRTRPPRSFLMRGFACVVYVLASFFLLSACTSPSLSAPDLEATITARVDLAIAEGLRPKAAPTTIPTPASSPTLPKPQLTREQKLSATRTGREQLFREQHAKHVVESSQKYIWPAHRRSFVATDIGNLVKNRRIYTMYIRRLYMDTSWQRCNRTNVRGRLGRAWSHGPS